MRFLFAWALCALCLSATAAESDKTLVLSGGTVVALSDFGRNKDDLRDAVVVIRGDRIVAVGARDEVEVPRDAQVLDVSGRYIVPGLVDGFATQNDEGQARAHLYMGVTTVFGNDHDPRRGMLVPARPGPEIVVMGEVLGYDLSSMAASPQDVGEMRRHARALGDDEIRGMIDARRWDGYGALLLYYSLSPRQVRVAAEHARRRGIITIGELGATRYVDAARAGVPIFVHLNRYLLDLAPQDLREAMRDDAFGPARARYMAFLAQLDPQSPELIAYGRELARHRVALMPTAALVAWTLPGERNQWQEPVAKLLDPTQIMMMRGPDAGDVPALAAMDEKTQLFARQSLHLLELHRTLVRSGVKFVVGSGTDAFGVLPGIGEHVEMALLVRMGLTPREALAAATANFPALIDGLPFGRIAAGARADVLVLSADPTKDIANVRQIERLIVRGELIDRAGLLELPAAR